MLYILRIAFSQYVSKVIISHNPKSIIKNLLRNTYLIKQLILLHEFSAFYLAFIYHYENL